ncbi:DUF4382 domain-containing protein [Flaviaesturariibacter amylovorans]|uniref:DUF4382 domain-containing protein n=1 Tax=Flaviaesturariibacter amylovorans TaxID=1084520 RepID=A0ABP8GMG2_9BACT
MKKHFLSILTIAGFAGLILAACSKKDIPGTQSNNATLQVYLTDDPGDYDSVVVDVRDVRINYSSADTGWQSLDSVGIARYDLLRLANGRDTLLGETALRSGRIQQIRLLLGDNNYVVVDGQRHALETPSAQQSGLKLNINQEINDGIAYKLLMDFDAGRSIHRTGNGRYMLKPVIRATLQSTGGSLRGLVLPDTLQTKVYAIQGVDTVAGTVTTAGAWQIRGLSAGAYSIAFVPTNTNYAPKTENVTVVANRADTVRTIQF